MELVDGRITQRIQKSLVGVGRNTAVRDKDGGVHAIENCGLQCMFRGRLITGLLISLFAGRRRSI